MRKLHSMVSKLLFQTVISFFLPIHPDRINSSGMGTSTSFLTVTPLSSEDKPGFTSLSSFSDARVSHVGVLSKSENVLLFISKNYENKYE